MGTVNTNKSGRKRTGTLEPAGTHADGTPRYRFRLMLDDGTRSRRFDVPQGMSETQAGAWVAGIQAEEDAKGLILAKKRDAARVEAAKALKPHDAETWDAWFARYLPTKECGASHRRISAAVAAKWVSPVIGSKEARKLTRDDVEDVRDKLDAALDAHTIRPSTARNAWSVLTGALKSAYAARDRSLRIHTSPLHFGVLPPKRGASRQRAWLYPREWVQFVTCDRVPVAWRQTAAVALYTGLRPGELRALTWADTDLKARTISVSKAHDEETNEMKAPKTVQSQRVIPILPSLLPLLEAMAGDDDDRVVTLFDEHADRLAYGFREHLAEAGLDRPRLTSNTDTEEPIDFRSLRDSHATWLALAGVNDKVIQRRMGHASPVTTDRYVKAAEVLDVAHIGTPFPPLPEGILSKALPSERVGRLRPGAQKSKAPLSRGPLKRSGISPQPVARVGFEPTTFGL